MIEETAVGFSSRNASHCARKSGGAASPAVGGTFGPQSPRNSRMRDSPGASRSGSGSGIQVLSCSGPLLLDRNSCTHVRIASGALISAPRAPMLPALAKAMERLTGQAPAMGASRIGSFNPYLAQNASARLRGEVAGRAIRVSTGIASGFEGLDTGRRSQRALARTIIGDACRAAKRRAPKRARVCAPWGAGEGSAFAFRTGRTAIIACPEERGACASSSLLLVVLLVVCASRHLVRQIQQ
jgi:hypothetical protein